MQQDEAVKLLEHLNYIHTTAKEAVALGDGTLKEANNTYNTLAGKYSLLTFIEALLGLDLHIYIFLFFK